MVSGLLQSRTCSPSPAYNWRIYIAALLLFLTLVVRLIWLETFPTQPTEPVDAEGYFLLARNLCEGHGFAIAWQAPYCPNTIRTPLYPLFLSFNFSLFGMVAQPVIWMQLLCEVLTCGMVIRLGAVLGHLSAKNPAQIYRVGLISGALYAINGTTQRYTGFLFAETFLLPILSGAVYFSIRVLRNPDWRNRTLTGVFWALACLVKPNVQFLALGLCALLAIAMLRWKPLLWSSAGKGIWMFVVMGLLIVPWMARNKHITSQWMLSSAFAENIARVAAVVTQAEEQGLQVEPWTPTWEFLYDLLTMRVSVQSGWLYTAFPRFSCSVLSRQNAQVATAAKQYVAEHLGYYVKAHIRGVVKSLRDPGHLLWYPILTGETWSSTGVVPDIWARIVWSLQRGAVGDALHSFIQQRIIQIPMGAAALWWGLWAGRIVVWSLVMRGFWQLRHHPWIAICLLCSILYILILPGPIAHDRFYMAAIPIVVSLTAVGLIQ